MANVDITADDTDIFQSSLAIMLSNVEIFNGQNVNKWLCKSKKNKQALINLLGEYMANVDITADDADIFQSSLAIMLRVVSDIAYRRLKLSLQYVFKKLKTSLMMNVFNNQTYFSTWTQKRKHWHGLDYAVNLYCQ